MKLGVLSDTHGFLDEKLFEFFENCDEIWHAGDIGSVDVYDKLKGFKPLMAVYGNIDGSPIRDDLPEKLSANRDGLIIRMVHIGGYPGKYDKRIKSDLHNLPTDIFITGHSHILKVQPDKNLGLLHINPGASGRHGLHHIRTAVRFVIEDGQPKDLEVIELGKRSKQDSY